MLGSIYIGLSGLAAYSKGLQTISSNVANLNTAGFKGSVVSFTDLFSHGGLDSSQDRDGEVGQGVRIGKPLTDFGQGDLRASSGDLDLAIDGAGFFVLLNGGKTGYTRTGRFSIDDAGDLIQQNTENRLAILDAGGKPAVLNIDAKRTNPPQATTKAVFTGNLSSTATQASVSNIAVYDSAGNKQVWTISFDKASATGVNDWTVTVKDNNGDTVGTSTLRFIGNIVDPATEQIVITDRPAGADVLSVTLDFSQGVTSFSAGTTSDIKLKESDGHALGAITTVALDEEGKVKLTYSNGQTDTLAAVAIADFRDPQQLQQIGQGLFENKRGASYRLLTSGKDGAGIIAAKQLEASNVDLSAQFGDLILVQRGYQASSQVVSIANDMIQQLFGIRGQG